MAKLNQRGIAQVVILLILLIGLGSGLILIQNPQIFKSQAFWSRFPTTQIHTDPSYTGGQCSTRIIQFSVSEPCDIPVNGFRTARYSCIGENSERTLGDSATCNPVIRWFSQAVIECRKLCISPTPTPTSTCQPRPTCLDTIPSCNIPEPVEGWCPPNTPSPTPEQRVCTAVITPARNLKTRECREFPTPCDVPEGWERVEQCKY